MSYAMITLPSSFSTMQEWVGLHTPSVGTPSRQDAVRFLLKTLGDVEKAVVTCHQERCDQVLAVKMLDEVTNTLCNIIMDVL